MQFTVQVEKTSHIVRKLNIRVASETVNQAFTKVVSQVQKTAKLKGFRPGMVPVNVVKQYYGHDIRHQVFHDLIDETYKAALRKEGIKAVSRPQIDTATHQTGAGEHDHEIGENQELIFSATVEVLPDLEVKGYTGIALSRESTEVTADDVKKVISSLMDSRSELNPLPATQAAARGNFVDMVFAGGIVTPTGLEKKPGMDGSRVLEIGSDQLIPGFEDNLIGMKAGETKTFRLPFPKDYFEKEFAGKESEFTVTVNEVKEKKLPELTDEFAKELGYENVADMNAKAQEHLKREKQTESDRKLRSDMLQALIDKNPFECPEALIQAQTRALAQEVGQNLKQQGFTEEMIQQALMGELENLKKRAENQVRASLILEAIAKQEGITLTSQDVDAEIKKMAESMKVEEEKVREFYVNTPNRREDLEFRMREERTVSFVLEKAKVKK